MTCRYVITGGASGIGNALTRLLLDSDPDSECVIADHVLEDSALALHEEFGSRLRLAQIDVRQRSACQTLFESLGDFEPGYLVNCAGNQKKTPSLDLDEAAWHSILDVHLDGTFYMCQAFAQRLVAEGRGGSIVNLSSVSRGFGWPGRAAYAAAKGAIDALTKTLAVEWADSGIRVNAVAPGYVMTEMTRNALARGDYDTSMLDRHALRRFAEPGEIASAIAFLMSPAASFITGEVLVVDGGFSAVKIPA